MEQGQEVAALLQNTPHAKMHVKPAINSHFSAFAGDGRDKLAAALWPRALLPLRFASQPHASSIIKNLVPASQ
jgi:hypothetical protein